MTTAKIEKRKAEALAKLAIKYDAARRIREILDEAHKATGDDDIENDILELVGDE